VLRVRATLDPDLAATAALIADPSRARMLAALADGSTRPAGELARMAGVSPQTASSHLDKLQRGELVRCEAQGRYRYYRLDPDVASLLETLAGFSAPAQTLTPRQLQRAEALRLARTCYGHLAGRLGVAITESLCARHLLEAGEAEFVLTSEGSLWFANLGINTGASGGRLFGRRCLDWSERRYHLAGALGVALGHRTFELGWIRRMDDGGRALRLTDFGRSELRRELDLVL
jgi:DNA-binding transcriptional ArsR family regulator